MAAVNNTSHAHTLHLEKVSASLDLSKTFPFPQLLENLHLCMTPQPASLPASGYYLS